MSVELICPECEKRVEIEVMSQIGIVAYCPWCGRRSKSVGLVFADQYDAEKREKELSKRLYCRDCEHIGLIEEFPFDAPPEDDMRERRCPRCHSDNAVNMGSVRICENCDKIPAIDGDYLCEKCADESDALHTL